MTVHANASAPLSFAQQNLYVLDQLSPNNAFYNIPLAYRIQGPLHVATLENALRQVAERHAALRTRIALVDGEAVQLILPQPDLHMRQADLQNQAQETREKHALHLAELEARLPFDLGRGPLLRALLMRLAPEAHLLVLTLHHIIADRWSLEILHGELAQAYNALLRGEAPALPPLPLQYTDFAVWQRNRLRGETLEQQLAYWERHLGDEVPVLRLPGDRPRPPVQRFCGAEHRFHLDAELVQSLNALALHEGATLFMVLLAAFSVFLHRYSGQETIVIGAPVGNRSQPDLEQLIGCFINTLALRTDLHGNPCFTDYLARVRDTAFDAFAHQELPFEKLVEALHPERSLSHNPLFQTMLVLHNVPLSEHTFDGLTLHPVPLSTGTSQVDLALILSLNGQALDAVLNYNTDLFHADTAARMASHFHGLLQGIIQHPRARLSELPLLSPAEYRQLIQDWNATERPWPRDRCLHQAFEAQAARAPDATALLFGSQRWTYAELNAQANRLAHRLRRMGAGPETVIGLCVTRSPAMLVAMLGILKAGGTYLPLDPHYPQERLMHMLEDSRAQLLVSQEKLLPILPATEARILCLDRDRQALAAEPAENPSALSDPERLAYLIYTSGSTGRPKGVAIRHRNAVAFLQWAQHTFSREELRGVLAATSICFDLSVFEIFTPLSVGGTVVLAQNVLELPSLPCADAVTLVNTVPSAIAELHDIDGIPSSVRTINLAGEPLKGHLVQTLYQRPHVERIWNLYGPSETTTYSSAALLDRLDTAPPSIGRPIANTRLYLLDAHLNPVPIGAAGEIYIGGAGVARGYLNQPELNASRFVIDPFSATLGERMYRTGDLGRYRPDGNIEFLGRIDNQVKIRGFRIELGEIEAVLNRHPDIRDCVVLARETTPDRTQLVAYYQSGSDALQTESLRHFLKQHLPDYMIPAAFVRLARFPHTPNGKLDRRRLPAPQLGDFGHAAQSVSPRNEIEESLAALWSELLHIDTPGIFDNFFELGGHSLLATQLISRMRVHFSLDVPLRAVFDFPSIAQMAAFIAEHRHAPADEHDLSQAKLAECLKRVEALSEDEVNAMLKTRRSQDS